MFYNSALLFCLFYPTDIALGIKKPTYLIKLDALPQILTMMNMQKQRLCRGIGDAGFKLGLAIQEIVQKIKWVSPS